MWNARFVDVYPNGTLNSGVIFSKIEYESSSEFRLGPYKLGSSKSQSTDYYFSFEESYTSKNPWSETLKPGIKDISFSNSSNNQLEFSVDVGLLFLGGGVSVGMIEYK